MGGCDKSTPSVSGPPPIRPGIEDSFQELGGGTRSLFGGKPGDGFTADIVDCGKLVVIASIAQGGEKLEVEMEQLSWALFRCVADVDEQDMQKILPEASENTWTVPCPSPS